MIFDLQNYKGRDLISNHLCSELKQRTPIGWGTGAVWPSGEWGAAWPGRDATWGAPATRASARAAGEAWAGWRAADEGSPGGARRTLAAHRWVGGSE